MIVYISLGTYYCLPGAVSAPGLPFLNVIMLLIAFLRLAILPEPASGDPPDVHESL